ncbi:MAG: DUF1697 domain-containing protein [Gemmatimonadaceae bacterium]|nr:DUF1697 domain-containing protein [Gemmatimonadaceae bacterium]
MTRGKRTRYLAFLRGMNVGGHRVSMSELRDLFVALKFANVETFIASGNVIFDTSASAATDVLEARIESQLRGALGYAVATFLRTPDELASVVRQVPFPATEVAAPGHTVHVGFLRRAPNAALATHLTGLATSVDAFGVGACEMYWLSRGRTTDSLVKWPQVEKALKLDVTMRNLTTVRKLTEKYPGHT